MTKQAAYEAVSIQEEEPVTATLVEDASSLYTDRPVATMKSTPARDEFSVLPEVASTRWKDTFFDEDDDVIAVFDFDYASMEDFNTKVGWATLGFTLCYTPLFFASLAACVPCYLRQNIQWSARAQHVCVTRDGIRFVKDRRKSCWGWPCTDQGKVSKTVPFDKITDCDIVEPAGNTCICIENVLAVVNIDTASSGNQGIKELRISGLENPEGFKKLVWAIKRAQSGGRAFSSASRPAPDALDMVERQIGQDTGNLSNEDVASLLRDIRDELRATRQAMGAGEIVAPPASSSSAPMAKGEE
jgi:hypothetical protein